MSSERTTCIGHRLRDCLIGIALLSLTGTAAAYSFVPDKGPANATHGQAAQSVKDKKQEKPVAPIDINAASKGELRKLPWIGDAEADRIIAARPYFSKADIVSRARIPAGVYQVIKRKIAVFPQTMPSPKG